VKERSKRHAPDPEDPKWPLCGTHGAMFVARADEVVDCGTCLRLLGTSGPHPRRFELHRDVDQSGISGTGLVAEGMVCRDGVVMMRWLTEWPSSVCYYERGIESVVALHGHGGLTRMVFLDD